jgi:hypothetical protein
MVVFAHSGRIDYSAKREQKLPIFTVLHTSKINLKTVEIYEKMLALSY